MKRYRGSEYHWKRTKKEETKDRFRKRVRRPSAHQKGIRVTTYKCFELNWSVLNYNFALHFMSIKTYLEYTNYKRKPTKEKRFLFFVFLFFLCLFTVIN
jgi:hypothetical protein